MRAEAVNYESKRWSRKNYNQTNPAKYLAAVDSFYDYA